MKSEDAKPKIRVRKARGSDRAAVFRFCEKTWSWGDYIPKVWDKWLRDKNCRVFVATINEVPVGICHLSMDTPNEVWLSGARTDPNYRRIGVASAIIKRCLTYAKEICVRFARLMTESDNVAAQGVVQKLGFKPVAEFVEMVTGNIKEEKSKNSRWTEETETQALWNYLQTSETYHKTAGLYTVLFHWYSLGKNDLRRFVEQRRTILHENEEGKIDGLILTDDTTSREWRENTIQTCYIDGDYEAVFDMANFLKSHCHASNIKKIHACTCNHKPITTALERLGFRPSDSVQMVYEKRI